MTYQIEPLPLAPFTHLFALSDETLIALGARRMTADKPNSAPCRVSLQDAEPGESLILVNHVHLAEPSSPYRSNGPVFVREQAIEAELSIDVIPVMLSRRLLSARVYDSQAMMIDADVVEGQSLHERLTNWFADGSMAEVHVHTARRGCYLARAVRA